ncbi:MAG: deoxycytidyl transferase [Stictis urceolatum]|nr:deoxycytidyl transferase [Stictis urceolata]
MGSRLEANSNAVRKKIEQHAFDDEEGEEYEASKFGGFTDYFRRKKIKLQNLDAERRRHNADKPQIFRGVVAHVNGYTQPSLNDLHAMIVAHGGGFLQYLDGKTTVTHVVASSLTPKKKVEFRRYRIVKPAWVVESLEAGRLLPWNNYRVIDEGVKQNLLAFDNGSLTSQANSQQGGYREQTDTSWYRDQVQDLADDLGDEPVTTKDGPYLSEKRLEPISAVQHTQTSTASPAPRSKRRTSSKLYAIESIDDEGRATAPSNAVTGADGNPSYETDNIEDEAYVSEPEEALFEDDEPEKLEPLEGDRALPTEMPNDPTPNSKSANVTPRKALSAEEHNAALLADPKVWKSTVVNPGFLKQYYEESRLHHLSTWKADLKSQLQALAQEQSSSQKARQKRPAGSRRYILHIDFDSFFAAVSLKQHPEWIDKPAVVAHGGGSGSEIASCNYPARKFGVKNGMWMKKAQKLCSDLKVLPYDFKAYEAASRGFYAAIMETRGIVQSVSVDEALLDMSIACIEAGGHQGKGIHEGSIWREQTKADEIAEQLRDTIKQKTGCAVSVGIGGNILLAKLALRKAKPAGQHQIKPEDILQFIGELTVQELPGVAYSIGGKLEEIGVTYVKDVRELSKERLINTLGPKTGEKLWEYARGINRTEVGEQVVRKSVSAEVNWGIRFVTQDQADEFIRSLCEELHKRLVNERVKGRQFTMKIMRRAADAPLDPPKHLGHGKCDVFNKSSVLGVSTNDKDILAREALTILKGLGFPSGELRGIGVQMTRLEPLKSTGSLDSSQRRLQFKKPEVKPESKPSDAVAPILQGEDIVDSPQKPTKFIKHPAAALSEQQQEDNNSMLNTMGTQFVLPSQVDPTVLAELPEDIRSKLLGKPQTPKRDSKQPSLNFKPGQDSPSRSYSTSNLSPSHGELDPEILAALPEDIRAEVLATHKQASPSSKLAILPSSPSKARTKLLPKKQSTPTKKSTTLLSRMRGPKPDPNTTLTQANFVARPTSASGPPAGGEVDADFLAALPADIRAEVLAQQRQSRLQNRAGLSVPAKRRLNQKHALVPQRRLRLPPKPPKPTFTSKKLSSLPELRDAVSKWVEVLQGDEPDEEDVEALKSYLAKVVEIEKDMDKAVSVVKWTLWLVSEIDESNREAWDEALSSLKAGVQEAVKKRGLGSVEF